jgi:predicted SAM-dependent methyltransferase
MRELLIGCGSRIKKDIYINHIRDFSNVTTLDSNPDHKPDVLWDLTKHPLPFNDNTFNEIHAYDVLEHLAQQGDYEFFFREFTEYARITAPDGLFFGSVPSWNTPAAFGDPSHKRVINSQTLLYLDQNIYKDVGKNKTSDFRHIYKSDWKIMYLNEQDCLRFILQNKKGEL